MPASIPSTTTRPNGSGAGAKALAGDTASGHDYLTYARASSCQDTSCGGTALDQQVLDDLLERYDTAAAFGRTHNRLRDWDTGNHPGYALGCWLEQYREQVFLFARSFAVSWTNNVSERGAKAAKRHQAVSGYWHSLATLARWCRLRSYLDSAAAHGITALDAISAAITGRPWLPPLPAIS